MEKTYNMFTGIISKIGEVKALKKDKENIGLTVASSKSFINSLELGDSVAVNGVCLTVTKINSNNFNVDVIPETLKLTNLKFLKNGDKVNLEQSLKLSSKVSGHFVSGHIDSEEEILSFKKNKDGKVLKISLNKNLNKYVAHKGSIAINGVSLTVIETDKKSFSVALIPFTLKNTNLSLLKKYDKVNIEVDLMARYTEKLIKK